MRRVYSQLLVLGFVGGPLNSVLCRRSALGATCMQARNCVGSSRDKRRSRPNADPTTGNQFSIVEPPDLVQHIRFGMNNLEHVTLPELSEERRNRCDMEKERDMRKRFGEYGPGERVTKSSQQMRREMLKEQQDVDGLPWEVRWRKTLIPTAEEMIQDVRDRFDLYIQDPIEREQEWYLHWKDRSFKIQKDRMIWPQGYTDYLDHYDEHGRRRVLPSDQRWSDTSWKHLADTKYKDRMWLIEGEERKAVHESLRDEQTLMEEEEKRQLDMGDAYNGIISGVVDLDPEQTYQALSGTADPIEVARTKMKIQAYGARQALQSGKETHDMEIDPVSGFPKSDIEPLPTGITVEQGAAIAAQATAQNEMLEQTADMARETGHDPIPVLMKAHYSTSKQHGDRPMLSAQVEKKIEATKQLQKVSETSALNRFSNILQKVEDGAALQPFEEKNKQDTANVSLLTHVELETHENKVVGSREKGCTSSGFIQINKRPRSAEPDIPTELYNVPQSSDIETMPQWYRETLVETDPLIQTYGLTRDPLEMQKNSAEIRYYQPPKLTEETRITNDDAISGISAFDEIKMHKLRFLPELVDGYKPLPLFKDVAKEDKKDLGATMEESVSESKRSDKLRKERQERLRKAKVQYDSDILLPPLPWETDSITDPYRGVASEDAVDFNKADLEKTWRAYRDTFRQSITEFGNLTQVTSEDKCEQLLMDTMGRFRRGEVGEHPQIPEEHDAIFRLVFEAHTKHFLADFYKFRGNRVVEAKTTKAEADDILRRASAKCKLLGPSFMNFIQEMISLELDSVRQNPAQRYGILVKDRKYEQLARPFMNWITNELGEFIITNFQSIEQLETNMEFLKRHVNDARCKCPMRLEGVTDAARDAALEAFYQWCRGALCFYAGKHLQRMYIEFTDTRFRSRAEELFEDSIEWFSNYAKVSNGIVQIPIPDSEPLYDYDEKDFLDGENAIYAEISGQLDKAEGLWHSGTSRRWYPLTDETEYMWYNERRGRLTLALDISDRCLENVNKKTHPSIHPFPESARPFLEGAPLTQETAEHLWMRYMGDLYNEHSEFMFRQGRFQTHRSYRNKCLNFYHMAIRTARERLPPSWKAPLLTEAKYMMRVYEPGCDVERHLKELETIVDKLFAEKEPRHWIEPFSELPYRLAVVHANLAAYGECITNRVNATLMKKPSNELLLKCMEQRAHGGAYLPELNEYFTTVSKVAEEVFRKKVLRWRAKEYEGSDPYLFWTHLYFAFRVQPQDAEAVRKMWDMYEPAYLYIYTQAALGSRNRGQKLINDALRRMCQILLPGDEAQKKILLRELTNVREKLAHLIDRRELDRTICALKAHLADSAHLTFTYGSSLLYREALRHEKITGNPNLRSDLAAQEYAELKRRKESLRAHETKLSPCQASRLQERQGMSSFMDEKVLGSQSDLSTKEMFGEEM